MATLGEVGCFHCVENIQSLQISNEGYLVVNTVFYCSNCEFCYLYFQRVCGGADTTNELQIDKHCLFTRDAAISCRVTFIFPT